MSFTQILKSAPVIAQARSFTELAQNVTSMSDPANAVVTAVKLIEIQCLPPHVKDPLKCAILFACLNWWSY